MDGPVRHVPAVHRGEPDWAAPARPEAQIRHQVQVEQLVAQVQRNVPFVSIDGCDTVEKTPSANSDSLFSIIGNEEQLEFFELHTCVKDYCFAREDRMVGVAILKLKDVVDQVGTTVCRLQPG